MLHLMTQGSLSCWKVARLCSITELVSFALVATGQLAFAAAKDDKRPAAAPATKPAEAKAAKPAANPGDGRLIRVRLPLSGNDDAHIKSSIQRAMAQLARAPRHDNRRPTLILELMPQRRHANYGEGT